jgi:AraC-like DNA-binding protein
VLEIDAGLVRRMATDMQERDNSGAGTSEAESRPSNSTCAQDLLAMVLRARDNIRSDLDRHILAPLYLQEIVYRLLQSEQGSLLRNLAASESASSATSTVIEYARAHLAEALTVADMAALVNLSPSAFAHQFRETTGRPPYQFVKEMRLDHARDLLVASDVTVARISKEVGYASVSHFISAFRGRFGVTPRAFSTHALHGRQGRLLRPPATVDLPRQRARM